MVEAPTVPVLQSRLELLEGEHKYLELIKEKSRQVETARGDYEYAKGESLEKKKGFDRLVQELQALISEGPPKPDPQGKLPFVEEERQPAPVVKTQVEQPKSTSSELVEEIVAVPPEIAGLDLTDRQKQLLAKTGAKTLADLIGLGNGNWPQFPKGFNSLEGFGPKAVEKLVKQLPSTAPKVEEKPGQAPSRKVRIELLSMSAASANLEVGDEVDATQLDDGSVVVELPGQEPVQFSPGEFRVVEQSKA